MPVVTSKKSAVPAAQAVAEKAAAKKKAAEPVEEVEEEMEEMEEEDNAKKMEELVETLKSLEAAELFKVMKVALSHAEKKSKAEAKTGKSGRGKKAGSAPKGVAPPQLRKPRAWVDFTLAHALENGWEEFVVQQKKKNKETGETTVEEIVMPASMEVTDDEGNVFHVYTDSVDDKHPQGRQMIQKEAMSLSKQRKTENHETWAEFEAQYEEEEGDEKSVASGSGSAVTVVRKSAAEKAAELAEKKAAVAAAKEAEKAEKKAAKEAEKAEKKAAAEAEKAAKKAAKEAEKAEKTPAKKGLVAAAAAKAVLAEKKAVPAKAAAPLKAAGGAGAAAAAKPVAKKPAAAKKDSWVCPTQDGAVYPWTWNGTEYMRNCHNQVWLKDEEGSIGDWQGVYLPAENKIDDSAEEPSFEDEE
jgi:hypothetical protein